MLPLRRPHRGDRKGTITVLSALLMIFLLTCVAFAIDVGYMSLVRVQAQNCADAAALAGAAVLVDDDRLRGQLSVVLDRARKETTAFAARNRIGTVVAPVLGASRESPGAHGDLSVGHLLDLAHPEQPLDLTDLSGANAVDVRVQCGGSSGEMALFFGRVTGVSSFTAGATAVATVWDHIRGFRPVGPNARCTLLPLAIERAAFQALCVERAGPDDWTPAASSGSAIPVPDNIHELTAYAMGVDTEGTATGAANFGIVPIGLASSSAAELQRQFLDGICAADLAGVGGCLMLDPAAGSLPLAGRVGLPACIEQVLGAVLSQPRTVLLYDTVTGANQQAVFQVVGFAGVRILAHDVSAADKSLRLQPAYVVDPTAVAGPSSDTSHFVVQPPRLVR